MPTLPGHQRNVSQGQHLIIDRNESDGEEDIERGGLAGARNDAACSSPMASSQGVFPGGFSSGSPPYEPARPEANKAKGICSDPSIRSNICVILGSILLTIVGLILLGFGVYSLFLDDGPRGWVFLFAGSLCFIPGFYHVYYLTCTLCGRPGYSLDKLPTFSR